MARFHGTGTRGITAVPQGPFFEGRFGRMFGKVAVFEPREDSLRELADRMHDSRGSEADNAAIPAGYTYLGQFVDHDITFDPTSSLERANDPEALANFRSPRFDLDSIYGRGPADEPFLYDDRAGFEGKFLLGRTLEDDGRPHEPREDDLARNEQGRALIGDPRNDENTIVSQLQLSFLKFHNRLIDRAAESGKTGGDRFKEAQRLARWHYQWVVAHDFLRRIIGPDLHARLLEIDEHGAEDPQLRFYRWKKNPFMPLEFSVAAYRFGHSQIRPQYAINQIVNAPTFTPGPLGNRRQDFRGFRTLPPQWTVSWPFFFAFDDQEPQPSRAIDASLADPLFTLPNEVSDDEKSLARRNLLRGLRMKLPPGEGVAAAMGASPLTPDELAFDEPAPLWYYILKEAEVRHGGTHLGPVGGRITGETLLGLLRADPLSYLHAAPNWTPELPTRSGEARDFDMVDLLTFAVPEQARRF